ncbi:MAG TPA: hemolysin III family protein [Longimicrobiaceae bacterium]|nr:hemolysin III family protein [Longimicrobiaceae bacterium]
MMERTREYAEEVANALSHGLGALASVVGGAVLLALALRTGSPRRLLCAAVYAGSLVLLYAASTLYHAARRPTVRARLRVLDHCAIFVLIAGTYTPFALLTLRGHGGRWLFTVVWVLAAVGVVLKLFLTGRYERLSTLMYLGMGWLALTAAVPLVRALPARAVVFIVLGGLCYTAGTFFFHSRRIPYAHAIWHGFVLAGSAFHFAAVVGQIA